MAPPPTVGTVEPAARSAPRGSALYWLDRLGRDAATGDERAIHYLDEIRAARMRPNAAARAMGYRKPPCPSTRLEREWSCLTPDQQRRIRAFVRRASQ